MTGRMYECGCYDGPWSPDDDTLVSVRCDAHAGRAAFNGHVYVRVDEKLRAETGKIGVKFARRTPLMAVPKTRRRRG